MTTTELRTREQRISDLMQHIATLPPPPGPWAREGLCAQVDPEVWYPERGGHSHDALATCARCPVRAECADHALTVGEEWGIWGGLTIAQRRRLRKEAS